MDKRMTQIGLTATPKETEYVSNTDYFGEPVFTYSLRQGINDGFLAPYKVIKVHIDRDVEGYRPELGQLDREGNEVEDRIYNTQDFDRSLVLDDRTKLTAKKITEFLKESGDRFQKTIVFCVDQEHAARMRQALEFFSAAFAPDTSPYARIMKTDFDFVVKQSTNYLVHEYFEKTNQPFYLHEFASHLASHRLQYLGDTVMETMFAANLGTYHVTHMLDSHSGTHLVPPAYALPPEGFDNTKYGAEVRAWLTEYEARFGRRGTSSVTAEQVSLSQTCGRARVIDVKHLVGTTDEKSWPASPEITVDALKKFEKEHGELKARDIVLFHSGHVDKHFQSLPEGLACTADPLNGKSEGWPAPGPAAIVYLAKKGIRCVGTDGPTLGGVDPKRAVMTYWALGTNGMAGVEFLTEVGKVPQGAYFVFAPVKIRDCHGGPGRALAFY
jgi:kynurenine formamidase